MNNWHVITGAPCTGKTTILHVLAKKGYRVEYEAARDYIDEQLKLGKTLAKIRGNEFLFQKKMMKYGNYSVYLKKVTYNWRSR